MKFKRTLLAVVATVASIVGLQAWAADAAEVFQGTWQVESFGGQAITEGNSMEVTFVDEDTSASTWNFNGQSESSENAYSATDDGGYTFTRDGVTTEGSWALDDDGKLHLVMAGDNGEFEIILEKVVEIFSGTWKIEAVDGEAPPEGVAMTLTFVDEDTVIRKRTAADGQMRENEGAYTHSDDGSLTFTRDGETTEGSWEVNDEGKLHLSMTGPDGVEHVVVLSRVEINTDIVGLWKVEELKGPDAPPGEYEASIRFTEDGKIIAFASMNGEKEKDEGSYTATPDGKITVEMEHSTVELTWEIDSDGKLHLTYVEGEKENGMILSRIED